MWDYSELRFFSSVPAYYKKPSYTKTDAEELQRRRRERKQSLAAAIAVAWTATTVTVLCPFCDRTHNHGYNHFSTRPHSVDPTGRYTYNSPSRSRCDSRVPPCTNDIASRVEYVILFPFERDKRVEGLSFELDVPDRFHVQPSVERFRTVGLDVPLPASVCTHQQRDVDEDVLEEEEDDKEMDSPASDDLNLPLQRLSLHPADSTTGTPGVEDWDRGGFGQLIRAAIADDSSDIERLFSSAATTPSLSVDFRSKKEESLLVLAAAKGHKHTVRFLLSKGADVNSVDRKGRTPLMEAALWTYPDIVVMLLRAKADKNRKDRAGRTAADLAEESDANDEERHVRHRQYTEDPFVAKRRRRLIRGLLGSHQPRRRTDTRSALCLYDTFFYSSSSSKTTSLVVGTAGIPIDTPDSSTAALLFRGKPFPVISAVSGWSGPFGGELIQSAGGPGGAGWCCLNGRFWMPETVQVAANFEFQFKSHHSDKELAPGSFFACHAEAMLMCYFVRRNYLFRQYDAGDKVRDDFLQLFLVQPRAREAVIIVSQEPCASCMSLSTEIQWKLGIRFRFRAIAELRG